MGESTLVLFFVTVLFLTEIVFVLLPNTFASLWALENISELLNKVSGNGNLFLYRVWSLTAMFTCLQIVILVFSKFLYSFHILVFRSI